MKIFRTIYSSLIVIPLTLVFTFITILIAPIDFFERKDRLSKGLLGRGGIWVKQNWFGLVLSLHRIKVRVEGPGLSALQAVKGAVFVANHQSVLDIPAISTVIPKNSTFLAKKELKHIPFFGWAAIIVGTQFIDRARGRRDKSLGELNELIQKGVSVILFPEGTRSLDGNLLSFKHGAFAIAIKNQAPVVPLTIFGSRLLCPKGSLTVLPGEIRVHVGNPISTKGMTDEDRSRLAENVKGLITKQLNQG
ncbi:MAG: 1-acyl-sn-glycerol-3-phosphate acyltransferase [Bacteriovoracaceae bacterium]|nr:1-acyl-sn-glycerol-3-phosphate acyltransferase [Bacteriovoracaceae bacterium]